MLTLQELSIEEQSELAQDFYQNMADKLQTRWKGIFLLLFAIHTGGAEGRGR